MGRRKTLGRVLTLGAVVAMLAPAKAEAVCWKCEYQFGLGFYCQPYAIMGYPDCFGPMLPQLQCSMYGEYSVFCGDGNEDAWEVSADGTVIGDLLAERKAMDTVARWRTKADALAGESNWIARTCRGFVMARALGGPISRTVESRLQTLFL